MTNDIVKNFGDFVLSRFGLDYHMFMSDEKKSLHEVLDNLSTDVQTLKFTKGDLNVWLTPEGAVTFAFKNGLINHYAQISFNSDGEPQWLCGMQNF